MVFLSKNKTIAGIIKLGMLSIQILKSLIASLHQTTLNGVLNLTPFLLGMIFIEMFMAFFPTHLIIKKLTNTNENTSGFFLFVFCSDIYRLNFSVTNSIGKHWWKNIIGRYRGNYSRNRRNKKTKQCDDV